jgi:hypothetical protein
LRRVQEVDEGREENASVRYEEGKRRVRTVASISHLPPSENLSDCTALARATMPPPTLASGGPPSSETKGCEPMNSERVSLRMEIGRGSTRRTLQRLNQPHVLRVGKVVLRRERQEFLRHGELVRDLEERLRELSVRRVPEGRGSFGRVGNVADGVGLEREVVDVEGVVHRFVVVGDGVGGRDDNANERRVVEDLRGELSMSVRGNYGGEKRETHLKLDVHHAVVARSEVRRAYTVGVRLEIALRRVGDVVARRSRLDEKERGVVRELGDDPLRVEAEGRNDGGVEG